MTAALEGLQPAPVWNYFSRLTRIPRPSRHEEGVRQMLRDLARQHHLAIQEDGVGNVIIRKTAHREMRSAPPVILQAHMDMVPQAVADSQHDFLQDPIVAGIDGNWVKASGTTLGADNGIGLASILAILADPELRHGPLEALFTCNEEDGMEGASGLQPGVLNGRVLINTDAEQEGELCIGCAGGATVTGRLNYLPEPLEGDWCCYRLRITGLRGGHSGLDIHRGRGNANVLLFRILRSAVLELGVRISAIEGGELNNAIPRTASATLAIPATGIVEFESLLDTLSRELTDELVKSEPGLNITATSESDFPRQWIPKAEATALIHCVVACPNGVVRMSDTMPGLVETSTNLAIVRTDSGVVVVSSLVRSAIESASRALSLRLASLFTLLGAATEFSDGYPGWQPDPDSPLLHHVLKVYSEAFGTRAEVAAIHAGLECGILKQAYPDLEMISFGPTIRYPHSPDERVDIDSVNRYWNLLIAVLGSLQGDALDRA